MGDVWKPNKALTRSELSACFTILELEWERTARGDKNERCRIASTACLLISGYFAALRGEELNRIHLGMIRKNWKECVEYQGANHIPLMLVGRFKNVVGQVLFCQPLCVKTKDGFNLKRWFFRCLEAFSARGVDLGLMFRNSEGKKSSLVEMDVMLHDTLVKVQLRYPSIIPDSVRVQDEYSVYWSLRRGATTEARNVRIPDEHHRCKLEMEKADEEPRNGRRLLHARKVHGLGCQCACLGEILQIFAFTCVSKVLVDAMTEARARVGVGVFVGFFCSGFLLGFWMRSTVRFGVEGFCWGFG